MTKNRYICKKEENQNGKTIEIYSFFQGESRRGSAQGNGATGVAGQEIWRAPSKITEWKNELLNNADKAFGKDTESKSELKKVTAEKDRLLKKVGQLTIDCDFFAKACEDAGLKVR